MYRVGLTSVVIPPLLVGAVCYVAFLGQPTSRTSLTAADRLLPVTPRLYLTRVTKRRDWPIVETRKTPPRDV
jgi:hypothetical protein